jgi:hypothetical protein
MNAIEKYRLEQILEKVSLARIFSGECVTIWIKDESPEPFKGSIDEALQQVKAKFPYKITYWFKRQADEGEVYYLLPRAFAHCCGKQYIITKCPKCEIWVSETAICNSKEPWNCSHGSVLYCAHCGAGVDVEGAVHGAHGAELSPEEINIFLKFMGEDDN